MKSHCLLFTFFLTFISSFSQTYSQPDTMWTKSYGTTKNGYESGRYVEQTGDGGYIVTGDIGRIDMSIPKWYTDLWLIKMDQYGDTLWTKTYDWDDNDFGQMVLQRDDGDFIVLGSSGYENLWIIKTDCFGDSIWSKSYQGTGNYIQPTNDGGYIIAGQIHFTGNTDIFLLKISETGDSLWMKTYDIEDYDKGYSVQQTGDGSYIISATSGENNTEKLWLIKTNALVILYG